MQELAVIVAPGAAAAALVANAVDGLTGPAALLAAVSAIALWRAGSVRAWRETAEARDERVTDLERELAELRAELAIPERIEGIVRLMGETAERQERAAIERLELALSRSDAQWQEHEARAESRAQKLLAAIAHRA